MTQIQFYKYHGCGNDFIIIDNRENIIDLNAEQITKLCHRNFGIGSDGLMLIENDGDADFKLIFYNPDGSSDTLCGNGSRCAVQFVFDYIKKKDSYSFLASDGIHFADKKDKIIKLQMNNVTDVKLHAGNYILNTGSPHYVKYITDIQNENIVKNGRLIRYNNEFKTNGINVNFVEELDENTIYVRTYERGVENETLSCGTGVTAAALISAHNENGYNCVDVKTKGGNFFVEFVKNGENYFEDIWLCGPATFVYKGSIYI